MSLRRRDAASEDESEISGVEDEFSDSDDSQASDTIREAGVRSFETRARFVAAKLSKFG